MKVALLAVVALALSGCVYLDALQIKYALTRNSPELAWHWCHCIPQTNAQWDACRGGGDVFASQPCRGQWHGRDIGPPWSRRK